MSEILNEHQSRVAGAVLDEEEAERHHLVVSLSGAHAYGFPSPDSDLDLKAIHIAPTLSLVGLLPPRLAFDRLQVIDGVEIDYTSNELGGVLSALLGGNGNYLERVLGAIPLRVSAELDELRPIARRSLSKKVLRHYNGFAIGQLRELDAAPAPTAKKVLYVLRTALTGTHLLRSGEVVTDLVRLWDEYGFTAARELVEAKRAGERTVLDGPTRERFRGEIERAFATLHAAAARSPLPEEPPNRDEVAAWLLDVRRRRL